MTARNPPEHRPPGSPIGITIAPLATCPKVIPTIAEWHHAQWGWMNPGRGIPERIAEFGAHLQMSEVPTTFIAFAAEGPIGSASIIPSDLPSRPELTPWLASVFVLPEARRRGVGAALVDRVVQHAHALGVETLYLFTPDQMRLYASLGWETVETVEHFGETETIMRIGPADRVDP